MSDNNGVTIDTPEGIAHFQMANAIARLRLETRTGMSASRGSTLQFVRAQYGIEARTKVKALRLLEQKYLDTYGWEYGKKPEAEDERLFLDQQGGRVVCFKHLGGYGKHDVEAHPQGTSRTVDGRPQWVTPLDVWMQLGEADFDAYRKAGYELPSCEDCHE